MSQFWNKLHFLREERGKDPITKKKTFMNWGQFFLATAEMRVNLMWQKKLNYSSTVTLRYYQAPEQQVLKFSHGAGVYLVGWKKKKIHLLLILLFQLTRIPQHVCITVHRRDTTKSIYSFTCGTYLCELSSAIMNSLWTQQDPLKFHTRQIQSNWKAFKLREFCCSPNTCWTRVSHTH